MARGKDLLCTYIQVLLQLTLMPVTLQNLKPKGELQLGMSTFIVGFAKILASKNMLKTCRCDRILWHGDGIRQLSYVRGESQFSDHRPVCATFLVDVRVANKRG